MKFPICGFDAKNAVLCPQCEGKVDSGVLTKARCRCINNIKTKNWQKQTKK